MSDETPKPGWRPRTRRAIENAIIRGDDWIDAAFARLNKRFDRHRPRHIAAYRGYADAQGVELLGRVLAQKPLGGPGEHDAWWDNLLNTYRRFDTDEVPGVPMTATFRGMRHDMVTDHEGYYTATFAPIEPASDALWTDARIALHDGMQQDSLIEASQPVLQVLPAAKFGIVSDIDDTILHSSITDWKTAAQLTFLGNARTRKPLLGVAKLYAALQAGVNPLFYVSSSPWNLYDLLDDFLALNAIPPGPIFLRDIGTDTGKFIKTPGHGHKLERARTLITRNPHLRWVLLGDSGQADAELYAEAAREFGERIAAIYIRDVDPDVDSPLDQGVDAWIEKVAGTKVPMLRAKDSVAIAEHAASIGLIDAAAIAGIVAEVRKDAARPTLTEAAVEEAVDRSGGAGV